VHINSSINPTLSYFVCTTSISREIAFVGFAPELAGASRPGPRAAIKIGRRSVRIRGFGWRWTRLLPTTSSPFLVKMFATLLRLGEFSQPFKRAEFGLFGGKSKQYGNNVPFSKHKTRRTWLPNVQRKRLPSEVLGEKLRVKVTTRALRTIKKVRLTLTRLPSAHAKRVVCSTAEWTTT
jgi:ribosomal protein L28